ncbi:TRAP transporter substrate-binding protein [Salipaludibacillus sp. CF4.18]|uniref:TRAP transporter substrate-binding protein n=1 Tax=Salipaludibacillus sp. CF4.18 TaxID=3373081 RepID=UPI003EE5511E
MSKKWILLSVATLLVVLVLAACGGDSNVSQEDPEATDNTANEEGNNEAGNNEAEPAEEKESYQFRLAETHAPDYPTTLADKHFAELVGERSDGRITIDVFPSASLGEESAVLEQVQLGSIDFTRTSAGPMAEFNEDFGVFSLPYIFDNDDHLWNFLSSEHGDNLLMSLESSNMMGLAYYSSGARHFYSSEPINSLEDLEGQKIRVQQNAINIDLMNALGASATPMDFGEVFSGLQTGVIDAAENNYPSYYSTRHFEVAPYYILDGHQRVPEVLVASSSTWEILDEEDQELIKQAATDSIDFQRENWAEFEAFSEEEVRAAGATIVEVDDVSVWQEAASSVIDEHGEQYREVLDAIESAR